MVRFKYRYFTVKINLLQKKLGPADSFVFRETNITEAIRNRIQELHGDFGVAAVDFGLQIKYCNKYTRVAVIRAQHGAHRFVASTLPLVKLIGFHSVDISIMYVGASIRHCFLFILRYQKTELKKIWNLLKSDEEKKTLEKAFLDVRGADLFLKQKDFTPFNPLL